MLRSTMLPVALVVALGSVAFASHPSPIRGGALPPGRARGDLLYVGLTACSRRPPYCSAIVTIVTYPRGERVGSWSQEGYSGGACSDGAGNVFIGYTGSSSQVLEFAHRGQTPIAILDLPSGSDVSACSVDPTTGNLAVASNGLQGLIVYKGASGSPTVYNDSGLFVNYVGYDDHGNAIVGGNNASGSGFSLAELPAGGSAFERITLDQTLGNLGSIQWDGSHMTVLDAGMYKSAIYQFVLNGTTGTVVGKTLLNAGGVGGDWIQGGRVVTAVPGGVCPPSSCPPPDNIELFPYPAGGRPVSDAHGAVTAPVGFAVSVGH